MSEYASVITDRDLQSQTTLDTKGDSQTLAEKAGKSECVDFHSNFLSNQARTKIYHSTFGFIFSPLTNQLFALKPTVRINCKRKERG